MDYRDIKNRAIEISNLYDKLNKQKGQKVWDTHAVMSGFVGDVGDLSKLIMAKNNLRSKEDIDEKLAHELSDCLWSIIVLADKLDIPLDIAFMSTMNELQKKITEKLATS